MPVSIFVVPSLCCAHIPPEQFANRRGSTVGTHRLSQDQFAGQGSLAQQLLKKKATQASNLSPRKTKTLTVDGVTLTMPPKPEGAADAKATGKANQQTKAKARRGKKPEMTMMEQLPNKTNFTELFSAPTPATSQVVSLDLSKADGKVSSHQQRVLERTIGEYARYLPPTLGTAPGETMKRVGALGYAQLTLGRARGSTPKQKQDALAIVSKLVGPGSQVSRNVHAS